MTANDLIETEIRTWEVAEGSSQGMSKEQVQPWKLRVKQVGDQLSVELWPSHLDEATDEAGLSLLVEIDKGIPAVHVSPSPGADEVLVHVRSPGNGQIEVAAGAGPAVRYGEPSTAPRP